MASVCFGILTWFLSLCLWLNPKWTVQAFIVSVDEGSYQPDPKLKKVRELADEALKIAHDMKLVKTKDEAEAESDSD